MARAAELHPERRPALRLLHAAQRGRQPDRQVQHRHRQDRPADHPAADDEEGQHPAAAVDDLVAGGEDGDPWRRRGFRRTRPDRGSDPADRVGAHQHHAEQRAAARLPARRVAGPAELHQQPGQPLVPAARLFERLLDSRAHLPVHDLGAAGARRRHRRDGGLHRQPGAQPLPAQHRQPHHRRAVQRRQRGDPDPRVRHRHAQRRRHHRDHQPAVRRDRLQDQRRPRQLQLDAAVAQPALEQRRVDERAVRARLQ